MYKLAVMNYAAKRLLERQNEATRLALAAETAQGMDPSQKEEARLEKDQLQASASDPAPTKLSNQVRKADQQDGTAFAAADRVAGTASSENLLPSKRRCTDQLPTSTACAPEQVEKETSAEDHLNSAIDGSDAWQESRRQSLATQATEKDIAMETHYLCSGALAKLDQVNKQIERESIRERREAKLEAKVAQQAAATGRSGSSEPRTSESGSQLARQLVRMLKVVKRAAVQEDLRKLQLASSPALKRMRVIELQSELLNKQAKRLAANQRKFRLQLRQK